VQAQVLTITVANNATAIQITTNALFFAGLSLDVIGGCIAYAGVVKLQEIHACVLRRTTDASTIIEALGRHNSGATAMHTEAQISSQILTLCQHLRFLDAMFLRVLADLRVWDDILPYLNSALVVVDEFLSTPDDQFNKLREQIRIPLAQYRATTDELASSRLSASFAFSASVVAPAVVLLGVVSFVLGLLCYVKDAQPIGVWATAFAGVGGVLLPLAALVLHVFHSR
jgi:hypothetical protein